LKYFSIKNYLYYLGGVNLKIIIRECKTQDYMDIVLLNKNEMGYEYPAEDRSNKNWRPRILCKLWIYKKQRPEKFQKNVLNYFSYM